MHELPWITIFLSRVRRFGNDFHKWRSHEWKSLPNRLTSDKKSLFTVTNVSFYFLHAILCHEHCVFLFVLLCCPRTGTVKDKGCVFQYLVFIFLGGKGCQITHPLGTIKLMHGTLPNERDNLLQISFWNVNLRCYNKYLCNKTTYFPDSLQQHVTHTCWTSKDMKYIIPSWHGYISISYLSLCVQLLFDVLTLWTRSMVHFIENQFTRNYCLSEYHRCANMFISKNHFIASIYHWNHCIYHRVFFASISIQGINQSVCNSSTLHLVLKTIAYVQHACNKTAFTSTRYKG